MKKNEIADKVVAFLEKIDEKQRMYIFIGILIFVFGLDYLVLMRPQLNALWKINPQIEDLRKNITQAEQDITNETLYRNQIKNLEVKVAESFSKVKSRVEVPLILEKVSRIANENGVKIDQIMPNPEDEETLLERSDRNFVLLPIEVEARSGYHNLGRFINQLEREGIMITVGAFMISAKSGSQSHNITLTLEAIIYEDA